MFTSISIVSSLFAVIFLLALFTYLLRLKYFQHKYIKLFMKLWIDIAFINFILSISYISIPIQNSSLFYAIIFSVYFLLFYYWKKTSVWSFMYLYYKIKEKKSLAEKEKVKLWEKLSKKYKIFRKTMYVFLGFVFFNMLITPGYQLDDWSFMETEVPWYMINESWEILIDDSGDWIYYAGYFDRYGNDWIIDQVRFDLNKDNKVDLKYIINESWEVTETLIDYSEARWIMIILAVIFFIFIFIKARNSKAWWEQIIASILLFTMFSSLSFDYKEANAVPLDELCEIFWEKCPQGDTWIMEIHDNGSSYWLETLDIDSILDWADEPEEHNDNWFIGDDGEQEYNDIDYEYYDNRLEYAPEETESMQEYIDKYTDKDWEKTEIDDRKVIEDLEKQQEIQRQKVEQKKIINDIDIWLDTLDNNDILNNLKQQAKDFENRSKNTLKPKKYNVEKNAIKIEENIDKTDYNQQKTILEIVTSSSDNLSESDTKKLALFEEWLSNLKDSASFSSDIVWYIWDKKIASEMRNLVKTHGVKSKEVTSRINSLKDHINKLKSSWKSNIWSIIKADKKWIRWLQNFNSKVNSKRWKEVSKWTKAKSNLDFAWGVAWNVTKWIWIYGDYNDFSKEFNWDRSKALTATYTQNSVWNIVSANPVDAVMWVASTIVSLAWYKDLASKMWDLTAWWVAKNIIKDSLWSSFKDIWWVISIELNRIKETKWIIWKTWAIITWWITSTYALWTAVVKVPLEIGSYVVWWIWKATSAWVNKFVNWISWLFSWRSSKY